jgi:hypothetical protein
MKKSEEESQELNGENKFNGAKKKSPPIKKEKISHEKGSEPSIIQTDVKHSLKIKEVKQKSIEDQQDAVYDPMSLKFNRKASEFEAFEFNDIKVLENISKENNPLIIEFNGRENKLNESKNISKESAKDPLVIKLDNQQPINADNEVKLISPTKASEIPQIIKNSSDEKPIRINAKKEKSHTFKQEQTKEKSIIQPSRNTQDAQVTQPAENNTGTIRKKTEKKSYQPRKKQFAKTENIDEILNEFQLTERETEKALREFHENFELLTKENQREMKADDERRVNVADIQPVESAKNQSFNFDNLSSSLAEIDVNICDYPLEDDILSTYLNSPPLETKQSPKVTNESAESRDSIKKSSPTNYLNVLKEISDELIGYDEETLTVFQDEQIKDKVAFATITDAKGADKKLCENYVNVLQDISNELVGADIMDVRIENKNYSQIIPPNVQDLKTMRESIEYDMLSIDNKDDYHVPHAPPRRHKSAEASRERKILSPSRSIDYDTISGISSTEYFDHYYSVAHSNEFNKYNKPQYPEVTKIIPSRSSYDEVLPRSSNIREEKFHRTSPSAAHQSAENNRLLSQRSEMLHKRKEEFLRDQHSDSRNPYIREMLRQDVENPINIRDIRFIRKHPTTPLPSSTIKFSSYVPKTVPTQSSTRTPVSYGRSSVIDRISSSHTPSPRTSQRYTPSSTVSHIMTKSHTISPALVNRNSRVTTSSYSDPLASTRTSRTSRYSSTAKKSSPQSRDACRIS